MYLSWTEIGVRCDFSEGVSDTFVAVYVLSFMLHLFMISSLTCADFNPPFHVEHAPRSPEHNMLDSTPHSSARDTHFT